MPIDVLWFRLSRPPNDPVHQVMGNVNYGKLIILIDRGDYFQVGLVIRKDSFDEVRQQGLEAFRRSLTEIVPGLGSRVTQLRGDLRLRLADLGAQRGRFLL